MYLPILIPRLVLIIDFETTGFECNRGIVEVGVLAVTPKIVTIFQRYVLPTKRRIDPRAEAVHKISLKELLVLKATEWDKVEAELQEFISKLQEDTDLTVKPVLLSHNASFDLNTWLVNNNEYERDNSFPTSTEWHYVSHGYPTNNSGM